jgi:death-on-curing protein
VSEPTWINLRVIQAFHDRKINEHGGLPWLRDERLLLSALSRPENAYHCSDPKPDAAELAAAYGFGFAKNHPFNDANKRTALIAMRLFLKINGYDLAASPADKYKTIIRVAASDIIEDEPAQKIRKNLKEIKSYTCVIVFNVRWLGDLMCMNSGQVL